ncbi:MAG: nuclear transport factor 2 family protein [Bacteroidia bacterium]|nr:nuclear transport factor 2 family protein [Bacteroidia bacterium]
MEKEKIDDMLRVYIQQIDQQNAETVADFLDENFRVVIPNFNKTNSNLVLSREQYLNMIKEKRVGGTKRTIDVRFIEHEKEMAIVSLITKNEHMTMRSYLNLSKKNDSWLVVNDMPEITNH